MASDQDKKLPFVGDYFEHDIFISYSHGNVHGDDEAWVRDYSQDFVHCLKRYLRTIKDISPNLKIFIDQNHRPNQGVDPLQPLSKQLKGHISNSAILMVLMSPYYLDSKWCENERNWWIEAQKEKNIPVEGRIATVRLWPTKEEWPDILRYGEKYEPIGFCFYNKEEAKAGIDVQPYSFPTVSKVSLTQKEFGTEFLRLGGRIARSLRELSLELKEKKKKELECKRFGLENGQVIYLYGRDTQRHAWQKINQTLKNKGVIVVPDGPDDKAMENNPIKIREQQQLRVQAMSACDALFVIGTNNDLELAADLTVIGRTHRNLVRSYHGHTKLLPCGLLDTAGRTLTSNWPDKAQDLGIQWFDATQSPWVPEVSQWFREIFNDI